MFQNWFGLRQNSSDVNHLEPLLKVLAEGTPVEQKTWIYAHHALSDADCLNILQSLNKFNTQRSAAEVSPLNQDTLRIVSRYRSGRFLLLVLQVPWLETHDEYCPLMLKHHKRQWCLVGFSQPWVELLDQFSNTELDNLQSLSAAWIQHQVDQS